MFQTLHVSWPWDGCPERSRLGLEEKQVEFRGQGNLPCFLRLSLPCKLPHYYIFPFGPVPYPRGYPVLRWKWYRLVMSPQAPRVIIRGWFWSSVVWGICGEVLYPSDKSSSHSIHIDVYTHCDCIYVHECGYVCMFTCLYVYLFYTHTQWV